MTLRQTKNLIIRTVILSKETVKLLDKYIEIHKEQILKTGRIFCNISDSTKLETIYHKVWRTEKELFKLVLGDEFGSKFSTHWFRSCRVVHLLQLGHSIDSISQITGMSAPMISKYAQESGIESKKVQELTPVDW